MAFPNPDASWAGLGRKNFYASFCALVQAKAVGVDGFHLQTTPKANKVMQRRCISLKPEAELSRASCVNEHQLTYVRFTIAQQPKILTMRRQSHTSQLGL
jgi:hypothetical protein